MKRYAVLNYGLRRMVPLATLLDAEIVPAFFTVPRDVDAVLGWGRRRFGMRAARKASGTGIPFLCLEDGFLRSVGLGRDEPPLSIVVDGTGIYYDATGPSDLERLACREHAPEERARAAKLMEAWRRNRVSKYNHARDLVHDDQCDERGARLPDKFVLVVDQTFGDASIACGIADASSFATMLKAALAENPGSKIVVKVHPEVAAGRKKWHFDLALLRNESRVFILGQDAHPASLLERAEALYVVTSQMGFEGLIWGKKVRVFGMPFYAGWGLTDDELPAPARRRPISLEDLVHAALIEYPRYIDPESKVRCEPEAVISWMGLQRRMRERFPHALYVIDFSPWKKPIVRGFLQGSAVRFVTSVSEAPAAAPLAVWGRKSDPDQRLAPSAPIRIEDGFIRSVGLGAELVRPLSWVIDDVGIYYDATAPSRLEQLLATTSFDDALLERARRLRSAICSGGITKYNVGAASWKRPASASHVILVPGQVETDASIRFGAAGIRRNIDLLKAVRESNRDAYLLYKPHPDVREALRRAGEGEEHAGQWCDEIVGDVPFDRLLEEVDEVHVLTSLGGFEALLREKKVVCYGQPFYAGWGLTSDVHPPARRGRSLLLDELVAATLILYPTYVSRVTGRFTTPERALQEVIEWRSRGAAARPLWRRFLAHMLRKE